MPNRCRKCDAQEGVGVELVEEGAFFFRGKYCVRCAYKLRRAFSAGTYAVAALAFLFIWSERRRKGMPSSDFMGGAVLRILFWQWLMIVPHELGHALVARALGFQNIRILVGSGRPIWSGSFLGFRWLINRVPFGGLTLNTADAGFSRSKFFLVVAAGPAVSLFVLAGTCIPFPPPILTLAGQLFWANAIVLITNLLPYHFGSAEGRFATDGLLILRLLFPKYFASRAAKTTRWKTLALGAMRILGIIVVCALTLLLVAIGFFIVKELVSVFPQRQKIRAILLLAVIVFIFGSFIGFLVRIVIRLIKEPFTYDEPAKEPSPVRAGIAELAQRSPALANPETKNRIQREYRAKEPARSIALFDQALKDHPNDAWLLFTKAQLHFLLNEPAAAIETIQLIDAPPGNARFAVEILRLQYWTEIDEMDKAEAYAEEFLASDAPAAQKIDVCEYLVCLPLYAEKTHYAARLEKWVHRALKLSPDNPSVKATLAGVWVELGRFAEAEPILLQRLDHSPNLQNRAFAMFYLALARAGQGRPAEATRLLEQALTVSDVKWLTTRAEKKLVELQALASSEVAKR